MMNTFTYLKYLKYILMSILLHFYLSNIKNAAQEYFDTLIILLLVVSGLYKLTANANESFPTAAALL